MMSDILAEAEAWSILLVSGDNLMRLVLRRTIEREGYAILEASTSQECLDIFCNCKPDVILVDVLTPKMDGLGCCQRLRELPDGDRTPILAITGEDIDSIDLAFMAGATDYITKPIYWTALRQRVYRLLQPLYFNRKLQEAGKQLEAWVRVDALTGLADRRGFNEQLDREWRRALREKKHLAVVAVAVGGFQHYVDALDKTQGESALKQIAASLKSTVSRPMDWAARYSGTKFALLLPNTGLEGAIHVAESARNRLLDHQDLFESDGDRPTLTVNLGVASTLPQLSFDPNTLVNTAVGALTQAIEAGDNTIMSKYLDLKKKARVEIGGDRHHQPTSDMES